MKIVGYSLLALFCLIVAGVTFLFIAAPVDIIRDQMVAAVKRETGRDLVIRGETAFSFYPNLGVTLEDVTLSPPPGMKGAPLLEAASLKLDMPVMALLQRRVVVNQFVLNGPIIDLRVDKNGRESWSFAKFDARAGGNAGEGGELSSELKEFVDNSSGSEDASSSGLASGSGGIAGLSLGDVRIVNGTLRYTDARNGTSEKLTNVNLKVVLDDLSAPLTTTGDVTWKGRAVPFSATVTTLGDVLDWKKATIALNISPAHLNVTFDGTVDPGGDGSVSGKLDLKSDAVGDVARWASGNVEAAGPIRTASLKGTLRGNKKAVSLSGAKFAFNDLSGSGDLGFRFAGRKKVDGNISVGAIRTASFVGGGKSAGVSIDGQGTGGSVSGSSGQTGEWSGAPIDFKPLKAIDADVNVRFESLTHNKIQIGKGRMRVRLDKGLMRAEANPIALYKGGARGTVLIDARPGVATYAAAIEADRIAALPLLKAVAGFDWLSGATRLKVDVRGRGLSQRQMIRTMGGTASFRFSDGAIEGLNIPKVIRGVQSGRFKKFDRVAGEKTDFSELSATFQIAGGVATNNDLALQGPLLRATGAGTANLGRQTINYRLTPKLVASLEGQGGGDLAGLAIPLKIEGPWARPRVVPDLEGVLQNPGAAAAAVNSIGKALGKSKEINSDKVKGLLEGVLGGGSGKTKKENPLGGLLGDFLKNQ